VKLRSKPVAIVFSEGVSLAKFGSVRISRDDFQDMASDRGEQFRGGLISVICGVLGGKSFNLSDELFELLGEQRMSEQPPAIHYH
jgi:hypothetical protein